LAFHGGRWTAAPNRVEGMLFAGVTIVGGDVVPRVLAWQPPPAAMHIRPLRGRKMGVGGGTKRDCRVTTFMAMREEMACVRGKYDQGWNLSIKNIAGNFALPYGRGLVEDCWGDVVPRVSFACGSLHPRLCILNPTGS
jgi:hypothetical protein